MKSLQENVRESSSRKIKDININREQSGYLRLALLIFITGACSLSPIIALRALNTSPYQRDIDVDQQGDFQLVYEFPDGERRLSPNPNRLNLDQLMISIEDYSSSPDGQWFVYATHTDDSSSRNPVIQYQALHLISGKEKALVSSYEMMNTVWSSNSKWVFIEGYTRVPLNEEMTSHRLEYDSRVINIGTGEEMLLSVPNRAHSVQFSSDSQTLYYFFSNGYQVEIHSIDLEEEAEKVGVNWTTEPQESAPEQRAQKPMHYLALNDQEFLMYHESRVMGEPGGIYLCQGSTGQKELIIPFPESVDLFVSPHQTWVGLRSWEYNAQGELIAAFHVFSLEESRKGEKLLSTQFLISPSIMEAPSHITSQEDSFIVVTLNMQATVDIPTGQVSIFQEEKAR